MITAAVQLVCAFIVVAGTGFVIVSALAEAHRNGVERLNNAGYSNGTPLVVLRARRRRHRKLVVARKLRKQGQL